MRNSQNRVETLRVAKYGNFPPVWIIDNSTVSPRWPAIKDHTKQLILDNIMVVLQGSGLYFDPRASLESLRSCVMVKMYGGSIVVCHAVARRRRRKVRVSDFDLRAFDSQRVVNLCAG